jgi:branched-chain amino acid transport system permease protein
LHGGAIARLPSERARSERLAMLALGALSLVLVAIGPMVVDEYSVNILVRSFLYGCIAVTVDILWGFTGILTFGQAAFFGIGAYALGLAVTTYDFSTPVVIAAFVAGPLVAAAVAVIVAWLAFGPKVSPLYISVVTLVQSVIFVQVIYSGGNFTGSSSGLSGFDTFDVPMEVPHHRRGAGDRHRTWLVVRAQRFRPATDRHPRE